MGKKDKKSTWAVARITIATQMLHQIAMGKSVDNGVLSLHDAFEKVENNDSPPPIFPDAILFLDKNHTVASLGSSGHNASCSR
jgi:hypothetical protein